MFRRREPTPQEEPQEEQALSTLAEVGESLVRGLVSFFNAVAPSVKKLVIRDRVTIRSTAGGFAAADTTIRMEGDPEAIAKARLELAKLQAEQARARAEADARRAAQAAQQQAQRRR